MRGQENDSSGRKSAKPKGKESPKAEKQKNRRAGKSSSGEKERRSLGHEGKKGPFPAEVFFLPQEGVELHERGKVR